MHSLWIGCLERCGYVLEKAQILSTESTNLSIMSIKSTQFSQYFHGISAAFSTRIYCYFTGVPSALSAVSTQPITTTALI